MTEHHADHDDLVALALQVAEPEERACLSRHLAGCADCRGAYASIEDAVHLALAAAPAVAPPAGFSGRVLSAIGEQRGPQAGGAAAASGRRAGRRTPVFAAAAALVVGVVLGAGGAAAVLVSRTPPPAPAAPTAGGATSASPLVTRSGEVVGTAGTAVLSGRPRLVITVTRARPGASYECVVVAPDGQRRSAGTWTLAGNAGEAAASGAWVVDVPDGEVGSVELLAPSGQVWARAGF